MILCMNCGKQELYAQRKTISRLELFNEDGERKESTNDEVKYDKPRCPRCGRYVKFFKDVGDVEEAAREMLEWKDEQLQEVSINGTY